MRTMLYAAVAALLAAPTAVQAVDINVPGDQPSIQAGIDAASNGDAVIVAQGEYFEHINFNGKAITVRSTDPTDPAVVVATIINGGGSGIVVFCESGESSNTVLSGFVITGGNFDFGGGMRNVNGSSPTVTNCSFSGNTANTSGGGMYNRENSSPTVNNCSFNGNTANVGGGGIYTLNSSPTVTNCTFSGNAANFGGGGGMLNDVSSPTVTNCTFNGNTANLGGGMRNINSNPMVTNCSFSGNTANTSGGGMLNAFGSSPIVTNTGFCDNTPDQIAGDPITDGGGNSLLYCPPSFRFCPADSTGDLNVDVMDLLGVLGAWGSCF